MQVVRPFEDDCDVRCVATPAGRAAWTVYRGPDDRLGDAHAAVAAWCERCGRAIGAASWEIHGDWSDDPCQLETTVVYLLA